MSKAVLAWVEVRVFSLFIFLHLCEKLLFLLFRQLLSVNSLVLLFKLSNLLLILLLFFCPHHAAGLLSQLGCRLYVVFGCCEVHVDVCLNATDLVIWLGLQNVNQIVPPRILDVDRAALMQHRIVSQLLL